jgi:DNA-directed RNA polymerase subunit RPC12/RpoP
MNVSETRKFYGTYRCPVCGHRDGTELEAADTARVVACPYCETSLEVQGRGSNIGRFEARVSRESWRG